VAGSALIGDHGLGMVPAGGLPAREIVTTCAICRSRNMGRIFTGRFAAVMAIGATGGGGKAAVIHIAGREPCRSFMTTVAGGLGGDVA